MITQENKDLLLKDLSARLPYEVKIELMPITRGKYATLTPIMLYDYYISDNVNYLPYLRPMSSMTEEEAKELYTLLFKVERLGIPDLYKEHNAVSSLYDWLNANYFDYCGLIEKGLAIEVTKENNPYKE